MPATKNLAWIAALCLLGLVIYALTGDPDYTVEEGGPAWVSTLAGVEPAGVTSITLVQGEKRLELARSGDEWRVPSRFGYRADGKKIATLLEQIGLAGGAERRGTSAASHPDFEVDAAKGLRLELSGTAPGLPITLTIGKPDSFDRVFVRPGDEVEVWSITPNLRYQAGLAGDLQLDPWLDLDLLTIPEEHDIVALRFETESGAIELRRVEEETTTPAPEGEIGEPATIATWKVVEPEVFEADPAIVRGLRSSLRRVRATAAADPTKLAEYRLDPPLRTLTISVAKGDPTVLEVGESGAIDETRQGRYARRRGDERVFLLATWTADNLFKTLDQLRPAPAVPAPAAGAAPAPDAAPSPAPPPAPDPSPAPAPGEGA